MSSKAHEPSIDLDSEAKASEAESLRGGEPVEGGQVERSPLSDRVVVYSSRSEIRNPIRLFREIYRDFMDGREIAWRLFVRNLQGMYRQTFFGLFWAFLPPIANTAMWIFLKQVASLDLGDTLVDGTVFILTGMILWQAFVDAFNMPLQKIKANQNMLARLRFPRESLLLVGIGEVLFNLVIRLTLLVPAFLIFGVSLHWQMLLAPIAILGLVLFAFALGLLLVPVGTLYQDVGRFFTMVMPFWMILTPIIYAPKLEYPGTLLNWLNPASPLLILSRDWLLIGPSPHSSLGIGFAVATLPLLILGLIVFRISMPVLIERMKA